MKRLLVSSIAALAFTACSNGTSGGTSTGSTGAVTGGSTGTKGSTAGGASSGGSSSAGASSGGSTGAAASRSGGSSSAGASSGGSPGAAASGSGSTGAGASSGGSTSTGAGSSGGSTGAVPAMLLVDNDNYTPPGGTTDAPLTLFQNWLTTAGFTYATYLEPDNGSDTQDIDVNDPSLAGINMIVYFTADNSANVMTAQQQSLLQNWLNQGGKTLVVFSPELVYDIGINSWTASEPNSFLLNDVGATEDVDAPPVWSSSGGDSSIDACNCGTVVTGSTSIPAFNGKQWTVTSGGAINYYWSAIQPVSGVDVLATIQADPGQTGNNGCTANCNSATAVATGRKHVGTAGTSTVVWVGIPVEDTQANLTGFNTLGDFFTAIQTYAAL